jgi:hypothetical protein
VGVACSLSWCHATDSSSMPHQPVTDDVPPEEVFPIVLLVLLVVVGGVSTGLYGGLEQEPPQALPWLQRLATWLAAWSWFSAYAHRHRVPLVVDLGWWFFGLWPLLIPYYLFKTQGRRALLPIGAYLALTLVSSGLGWLIRAAISQH